MDEVDVPAQSELGRQEPEVVLAGDEVGRGRHMDHDVDVGGVESGVDEGGAPGSQRQISVVEAAVGPAPLAPPAELVVQAPLMDAEVLDDPLGLERSAVRANGAEVFEDLLVGDSVFGQVGADAHQGDRDFGSQPWDRGIGHRTTSQSSEIGSSAGRGSISIQRLSRRVKQWQRSQSRRVMATLLARCTAQAATRDGVVVLVGNVGTCGLDAVFAPIPPFRPPASSNPRGNRYRQGAGRGRGASRPARAPAGPHHRPPLRRRLPGGSRGEGLPRVPK